MDFHAAILRNRFWLRDLLHGGKISRPYREIRYMIEHEKEEIESIRNRKLRDLLQYAQNNTVFYRDMKSFNLSDYPIMDKTALIEHMQEISVKPELILGQKGSVHIQRTSGSTGTPFAIPQDTKKRNRRVAELKYFGKIVGFDSHEKLIHLRAWNKWQKKSSQQIKSENIIPFDVSTLGDEEMVQLCNLIVKEKALCLRGYVSAFNSVANYILNSGIEYKFPSLRIIIAGGEALHDDVRAKIKEAFGCDVMSQYADEECGILAQERVPTSDGENVMYWNNASYVVEVLKMDSDAPADYGEPGRVVITDLHNYAFPMIRYDCGDVAVQLPPNEYSHGYPVLGKLMGRRFDLTYSTDGKIVHPLTYGRTFKHFDSIVQWQFVQKKEKEYVLKVVLRDEQPNLDEAIEKLYEVLGKDAEISIEVVNELPVLASGKRKAVENEWKH